jgi:hypothetical protein
VKRQGIIRRLHPGWSWTVRYPRVIPSGYAVGSLCLGLGLSVVVVLVTGGLHSGQVRRLVWLLFFGFGLAIVVLGVSEIARRGRNRMLSRNGTAYIITERARDWQRDEPDDFYAQVPRHFARVVQVPGPGLIGPSWDWPLDQDARCWDARVTELARSFRTLNLAVKEPGTPDGIFMTAWWPVALAFGQRVTAADRSLDLQVWQRPSHARAGAVQPDIWSQRPHRFDGSVNPADLAPAGLTPQEFTHQAGLTLDIPSRAVAPPEDRAVSLLLVRFGFQAWGPLPSLGQAAEAGKAPEAGEPLHLELQDAAGIVPKAASRILIHEFRCVPRGGAPRFEWSEYPFLAASATTWIKRKARTLGDHSLLFAAVVPNEVGLGIGICVGSEAGRDGWPGHMWPLIFRKPGSPFVVPRLELGAAALREGLCLSSWKCACARAAPSSPRHGNCTALPAPCSKARS